MLNFVGSSDQVSPVSPLLQWHWVLFLLLSTSVVGAVEPVLLVYPLMVVLLLVCTCNIILGLQWYDM